MNLTAIHLSIIQLCRTLSRSPEPDSSRKRISGTALSSSLVKHSANLGSPAAGYESSSSRKITDQMNYDCKIGTLPLVSDTKIIVEPTIEYEKTPFLLSPLLIFSLLLILTLIFSRKIGKAKWIIIDRVYFTIIGVLGLVTALLWFATDHGATVGNYNLLWASPLYLVYVFTIGSNEKKWHKLLKYTLIASNITMIFGIVLPQDFNLCFYPLIGISLTRLAMNCSFARNKI